MKNSLILVFLLVLIYCFFERTNAQFFSASDGISFGRMGKRGYIKPKLYKSSYYQRITKSDPSSRIEGDEDEANLNADKQDEQQELNALLSELIRSKISNRKNRDDRRK